MNPHVESAWAWEQMEGQIIELAATPLSYVQLMVGSEAFGLCRAVQYGGILVATMVYGAVCHRLALRRLLWLAIVINILPGFLYLLIRGTLGAVTYPQWLAWFGALRRLQRSIL